MGIFFVGWQLWEDLTFILACAIVLVFAFGLVRLWWQNRRIARLELVDEERRARLAEMRHCGINSRGNSDIPFGVRAIQSGVEVDGIWISRSNTPQSSRAASSATLIDDYRASKAKGKLPDRGLEHKKQSPHARVELAGQSSDGRALDAERPSSNAAYVEAYTPTGLPSDQYQSNARNQASRSSSAMSANRSLLNLATYSRSSYASTKPILPGEKEGFFDMSRMDTNENEIFYDALPVTGSEDHAYDYSSPDTDALEHPGQRSKLGYARLQRKPPPSRRG